MRVKMFRAQKRLANLWFVGCAVIFLTVVIQSITSHYGDDLERAWGWLLPNILPSLSLIVGALVVEAQKPRQNSKTIDRYFLRLAFSISSVYMVVVLSIILVQPLVGRSAISLMEDSQIWLGPLQGIVGATIGIFYAKSEEKVS